MLEERFSGGGVQIWQPFVFLPLCLIHVFKGNFFSEIQLCGKRRRVPVGLSYKP